jgi:hypothetical protein
MLLLERVSILLRMDCYAMHGCWYSLKVMPLVVAPQVAVDILESIVRQEVKVCSIHVKVRCLEYQSISGFLVI